VTVAEFRVALLKLWAGAHEFSFGDDVSFPDWSGATKDLLLDLGMEYDNEKNEYVFREAP
jgi:hypothetical protein